ncbi:hypothetical protein ASPCADRAFT_408986 [Aspergillus carbonarius ITEM 5010]|uniref:Phenylalanine ammonia-lyase n=1 Tax=Aspergillus carbonarius (strain ITEM 5010) TaxID=602072 RepID=A0A1R3RBM1_ASPC5|nr:hypothetical protein ASPCADRAFT_408986 [Aspergillus carbonarius ITEM 5010]
MADASHHLAPGHTFTNYRETMLSTLIKVEQAIDKGLATKNKSYGDMAFTESVLESVSKLKHLLSAEDHVRINGHRLDLAGVVAVAKYGMMPAIVEDDEILQKMNASITVLNQYLSAGNTVYGVNTGFGGSADARSDDHDTLQKALIQHHNAGVLLPAEQGLESSMIQDCMKKHCMPIPLVKAAMLTRCNNLIRGHSAVRPEVVRHILTLVANDFTPVVPLRGSISASGDLTPLAYVAGAIEGNPDIFVDCGSKNRNATLRADEALTMLGLKPLSFLPKEGLGILNGTAFSAGAASLVLFEANQLAIFAQITTIMCTEALMGTRRNFHPFIGNVRPHPGQREAARNMYSLLADSKLATNAHPDNAGLAQDRYAIRTTSQWIGPQIETLALATRQVECELNSTTDNPLLDPIHSEVHHGGNFQAVSITSAMEKVMACMQMIGKMVFAQCSELLNPMFSKGLPPSLCADDPSLSFAFKGVDINMASYMSELAYLAHPVSNSVQSAEMHNQSINSLALVTARYAADTVEVMSLMMATHIYVLCQALDLRVLQLEFEDTVRDRVDDITASLCEEVVPADRVPRIQESVWKQLIQHWTRNTTLDLADRAETSVINTLGTLLNLLNSHCDNEDSDIPLAVLNWQDGVKYILAEQYDSIREEFFRNPTTTDYLCTASIKLYNYVRKTLGVPMHKGIVDHPTYLPHLLPNDKQSIGSLISTIYIALREGDLMHTLVGCFEIPVLEGISVEEKE